MRILRIVMSVAVMVQGYQDKQSSFVLFGFVFLLMSFFGIGCCDGGSCISRKVDNSSSQTNLTDDITYEEVH